MLSPNNYFGSPLRAQSRQCECCTRSVIISKEAPEVFGAGRFCSRMCSRLRTPEAHYNWMTEHPEEFEAWQEWKRKQELPLKRDQLGGEVILPI